MENNRLFTSINYKEDFTYVGAESYVPHDNVSFCIDEYSGDYTFNSKGIFGYNLIKGVKVYTKSIVPTPIWYNKSRTKIIITKEEIKDLYIYYRAYKLPNGMMSVSQLAMDKLITESLTKEKVNGK